MSRAVWLVTAAVLTVSLAGSAVAQEDEQPDYDPVGVLVDALETEEGRAFSRQFTTGEEPYRLAGDPRDDAYSPTGDQPGHTAPHTDIIGLYGAYLTAESDAGKLFRDAANGGPWCAESGFGTASDIRTVCPPGFDGSGAPFGGEGVFVGTRLATDVPQPPPDELCEFALWAFNPNLGPPFDGPFGDTGDPADGMNVGVGARWVDGGWSSFALVHEGAAFRDADPGHILAAVYGDYYALVIPPSGGPLGDLAEVEQINAYAFCGSDADDKFAAQNHVADETEEVQTRLTDLQLTGVSVSLAAPAPSPSPSPSPEPTEELPIGIPETEAVGDEGLRELLPIVVTAVGGLLTLVGLFLWLRPRRDDEEEDETEREKVQTRLVSLDLDPSAVREDRIGASYPQEDDDDEEDEPDVLGPTRTRDREPDEDGTPPASTTEPGKGGETCGWGVILHRPGQPDRVLRKVTGHRCCVYHIIVRTKTVVEHVVGRGRHEGPDRLRLLDPSILPSGVDVHTRSSVRTGPAGELSWMDGLGESGRRDDVVDDEPYWQRRSHEEPPDVALHLRYGEETTVEVQLESECPGHRNIYAWEIETDARLAADHECTNDGAAPCPVELTAGGWASAAVIGDVLGWCGLMAGSDVDEMEGIHQRVVEDPGVDIGEDGGLPPVWDSHDHAERDRAAWSDARTAANANTVHRDSTKVVLHSHAELDSGTIVPASVHDTTDRVTAEIAADVKHTVDLDALMKRTVCDKGPCCGHGTCLCDPAFELRLWGGGGAITVEGRTTSISRPPTPQVGVDYHWDVT